ncbi:MAG TPA: carbamoyltransferase N-terminal domain-containing protein [Microthrixaceae bacterium]|nr:carbamoyltransferase N-terminal domain-containing protein [Microthrixaceae bacterium]HMT24146.1 carbamoyltransferase N-terminal domain-containing protein [Microthrixaceae bacterium]HMT61538.1 carbamoyltransferase N-terminal domain-containing protein [Microthrixaceae bacterium]
MARSATRHAVGDARVIVGVSHGFHDAAAAVLVDGNLVAAVEEERLTRVKHESAFPERALDTCLAIAGLDAHDVDLVAYHQKPVDTVSRHLAAQVESGPSALVSIATTTPGFVARHLGAGPSVQRWFRQRSARPPAIAIAEHHMSHAAASFFTSPFEDAATLTVDGVGEWASTTIGIGRGRRLTIEAEQRFPHSLGLVYTAFTTYCGFAANGGEGQLMGLAPFGTPRFVDAIRREVLSQRCDGSIAVAPGMLALGPRRRAVSKRFERLFGGPPRPPGSEPTQREADLAASIQLVIEEALLALATEVHQRTRLPNLCLGGGVALNCVANGRLAAEGPFDSIWVQPAAGDAGNAIGAALWAWHNLGANERTISAPRDAMCGAFLGPRFDDDEIREYLVRSGVGFTDLGSRASLAAAVAHRIERGAVAGWFQGRMEFGPRALGHRSIVADPRSPTVKDRINRTIKHRADFRPFAPAVLSSRACEWFDLPPNVAPLPPTHFMTMTCRVRGAADPAPERADGAIVQREPSIARRNESTGPLPAVTHTDGSARVQTVDPAANPEFADLISAFEQVAGCPVLLNTSFNAGDEPVVCTPSDALATFGRVGLDTLGIGRFLVESL